MSEHANIPAGFDLAEFFRKIKTIAIVGYSDNPERAGHYVSHYLADAGYEVIAVNPRFAGEVNGLKCYKSLAEVPRGTQIDVVTCFRSPKFMPDVARAAAGMDPRPTYLVMQPGAESDEAADIATEHGTVPLMLCMMAMHKIWAD